MQKLAIPIVDGKYKVAFPPKCVYCGAPKEVTLRKTASAGPNRRRRIVAVSVPYCATHARVSKRNSLILTVGLIAALLFSCGILFGITTSFVDDPSDMLLVFLGFAGIGLALVGRELLRRVLARSSETMRDSTSGGDLGIRMWLAGPKVMFSFSNGRIAAEFAQLNGGQSGDEIQM